MRFPVRPSVLSLVTSLLVATGLAAAQPPAQTPLSDPIPLDPAVTHGEFDNGLQYYIQANSEPENRAELRLVVNVGSIVEDDDQLGLAHFVEHMAFNGTENFPKQALVEFMESIGMRFGPGVNASTNFDETSFMLRVPTDEPEALKTAFLILEDWAHRLSFDPEQIDQERGVIIEEWRLRRGAAARMQDAQFPVLLQGSHYAYRLPIGTTENLETFPHDRLKQFYADWYRPDLMAVIAVGDFDETRVQALVEKHFGSLPAATSPRPRSTYEVPDHEQTLFAITSDPEAPTASVAVYAKFDARESGTYGAYRRSLVEGLFSGMLGARMSELAQKPNAPFLMALSGRRALVRTKEAAILTALVKEDGIAEGLTAAFREIERVARFGFVESELDRLKVSRMRSLERASAERDNRRSSLLAAQYIGNFLRGAPVPSLDMQLELATRFLPEITVEELNSLAADWIPEANRVVVVAAPEKEGLELPDEAQLTAAMAAAAEGDLEAYVDAVNDEPLIAEMPQPGAIVREAPADEWGIIEWKLSNGVTVAFLPTEFREDQIVFRGISPGGTSLASDDDYIAVRSASALIRAGGLGVVQRHRSAKETDRQGGLREGVLHQHGGDHLGQQFGQGPGDRVSVDLPLLHPTASRPADVRGLRHAAPHHVDQSGCHSGVCLQ